MVDGQMMLIYTYKHHEHGDATISISEQGGMAVRSNPVTGQTGDIVLPIDEEACTAPNRDCNFEAGKSALHVLNSLILLWHNDVIVYLISSTSTIVDGSNYAQVMSGQTNSRD